MSETPLGEEPTHIATNEDLKQTIEELRRERELIDEAIEILEALMKRRLASVPEPRRRGTPPGSNRTRRGTENTPEPNP